MPDKSPPIDYSEDPEFLRTKAAVAEGVFDGILKIEALTAVVAGAAWLIWKLIQDAR